MQMPRRTRQAKSGWVGEGCSQDRLLDTGQHLLGPERAQTHCCWIVACFQEKLEIEDFMGNSTMGCSTLSISSIFKMALAK